MIRVSPRWEGGGCNFGSDCQLGTGTMASSSGPPVWKRQEESLTAGLKRLEVYVEWLATRVEGRVQEVLLKLQRELHEAIETGGACGRTHPGGRPGKKSVTSKRQAGRPRFGGRSAAEYCIDSGVEGALGNLLETFFGDSWKGLQLEVGSAQDGREVWRRVFEHFPGRRTKAGGVLCSDECRDAGGLHEDAPEHFPGQTSTGGVLHSEDDEDVGGLDDASPEHFPGHTEHAGGVLIKEDESSE